MHFSSRSYRLTGFCILSVAIILLDGLSGFTQAPHAEHSFPTQYDPRVIISNASTISITSWDKGEVSVAPEVSGASIQVDEVRIKPEKNKLEITCEPSKPDRNIHLTLRVPAKTVLEINSHGNRVEVKEPIGQITIIASKELIQLSVPESSSLDMQDAPKAFEHQRLGQGGSARIGIGKRRMGTGSPYVKVTAATALVIVARGYIASVTPFTRPPTIAATTIARRTSSMSRALRRSNPQLIRPRRDQPSTDNSPDPEAGALKLETHLVNLNVSATDKAGRAIPDLKQEDFSVYEDGLLHMQTASVI